MAMEFEVSFRETLRQLADAQTRLNSMGKVLDANTAKSGKMASSMAQAASRVRTQFDNLERSLEKSGRLTQEVSVYLENARVTANKTFQSMAEGNTKATLKLSAFNGEMKNLDRLVKDTAAKQAYIKWQERTAALSAEAAGQTQFYRNQLAQLSSAEGVAAVQAAKLAKDRTKAVQAMTSAASQASNYRAIVDQLVKSEREMATTGQKVAWGYERLTTASAAFTANQQRAKEAVDLANKSMVEGVNNLERYTGANARAEQAARSLSQQEQAASNRRSETLNRLRVAMQTRAAQEDEYASTARKSEQATRKLGEAEARTSAERERQIRGTRAYNEAMQRNADTARVAADATGTYAAQLSRLSSQASSGNAERLNQGLTQVAAKGREATSSLRALTTQEAALQVQEERLSGVLRGRNQLTVEQVRANTILTNSEARQTEGIRRQTEEYKRNAQYAQMTNAQLLGFSGTSNKISRDMRLNAQAAAMFRAGLGGLNASIGIYTSATVLAASATYAFAAALRGGVSAGMEFTETMARAEAVMMTGVQTFSSAGNSLEAVEMQVRALGASTIFTATEVAGGLVDLGMAGLSSADAMMALEPALNLASIGAIEMSRSADIATNVMTSFNKTASELEEVVDVMATAITNSNTSIEQLANALSYVGPAAQAAGFELKDTTAAIELLSNAGIKASRAGTGLRRFMLNIQNPTAKGSAVLDRFNISIVNAEGATRSMTDILGQFNQALHNDVISPAERTAAIMDLVGVRAQSAVSRMIGAFDEFGVLRRQLDHVAGAAEDMRDRMEDVLTADFKQMKSAFQDLQLDVFESFEYSMRSMTSSVTLFIRELQTANTEMTEMVFSPEEIADGDIITDLDIMIARMEEAGRMALWVGGAFMAWKSLKTASTMTGALSGKLNGLSTRMSVLAVRNKLLTSQQARLAAGSTTYTAATVSATRATDGKTAALSRLSVGAIGATGALARLSGHLLGGPLGLVMAAGAAYTAVSALFSSNVEERVKGHNDRIEESRDRYKELQEQIDATREAELRRAMVSRRDEAQQEAEAISHRLVVLETTLTMDIDESSRQRVEDQMTGLRSRLDNLKTQAEEAGIALSRIGTTQLDFEKLVATADDMAYQLGDMQIALENTDYSAHSADASISEMAKATQQASDHAVALSRSTEILSSVMAFLNGRVEATKETYVNFNEMLLDSMHLQRQAYEEEQRFNNLGDQEKLNELLFRRSALQLELAAQVANGADIGSDSFKRIQDSVLELNEEILELGTSVTDSFDTMAEKQAELQELQLNEAETLETLEEKIKNVAVARMQMYAAAMLAGDAGRVEAEAMEELLDRQIELQGNLNQMRDRGDSSRGNSESERELERMLNAYKALRDQYDPVISATEEFKEANSDLDTLLANGQISSDQHRKAVAELTRQYEQAVDPLKEIRDQLSPIADLKETYQDKVEKLSESVASGTVTQLEAAKALAIYNEELKDGLDVADPYRKRTKELLEEYENRDEISKVSKDIQDLNERIRDESLPEDVRNNLVKTRNAASEELQRLVYEADDKAQEFRRSWEQAMDSIDSAFVDGLEGMFNESENLFEDFSDTMISGIKRMIAEMIYQASIKPIVVDITTSVGGALGIPGVGGQSMGGGNLMSMGKDAYGAVTGGLFGGGSSTAATAGGLYSTAATGAAQGGLYGNVATGGLAGSGGIMSGMGSMAAAAGPAAAVYAGIQAANWLDDKFASDAKHRIDAGGLGVGLNMVSKGIFGGSWQGTGKGGVELGVSEEGFEGKQFAEERKSGGLFSGSSYKDVYSELDSDLEQQLSSAYDSQIQAAERLFLSEGQEAAAKTLDAFQAGFERIETSGMSDEEVSEAISNWLSGTVSDAVGGAIPMLEGDFGDFVQSLEGSADKVIVQAQAASEAYHLLGNSIERLNLQFDDTGAAAYSAAADMAELTGGVENLANLQSSYYQNFFSEVERAAHLQEDLTGTLKEQNLTLPDTRKEYRSLVEAQNLNTEAGRENYATLLQVAGGFDQLQQSMEKVSGKRTEMQITLLNELGRESQALAMSRRMELDSMDESLHGLQMRIWAIQDAKEREREAINDMIDARQAALSAEQDAMRDTLSTMQDTIRVREQQVKTEERALESLKKLRDSLLLGNTSNLDPRERLDESRSQYEQLLKAAESGDADAAADLSGGSGSYLEEAAQYYGQSSDAYADIFDEVNGSVDGLVDQYQNSLSTAERQLRSAERAYDRQERYFESSIERMERAIEAAERQLERVEQGTIATEDLKAVQEMALEDGKLNLEKLENMDLTEMEALEAQYLSLEMERESLVATRQATDAMKEMVEAVKATGQLDVGLIRSDIQSWKEQWDQAGHTTRDILWKQLGMQANIHRELQTHTGQNSQGHSLDYSRNHLITSVRSGQGQILSGINSASMNIRSALSTAFSAAIQAANTASAAANNAASAARMAASAANRASSAASRAASAARARSASTDGSHRNGLDRVPFDGYRAELHRDEMVLTAPVADTIRNMAETPDLNRPFSSNPMADSTSRDERLISEVKRLREENERTRKEINMLRRERQEDAKKTNSAIERTASASEKTARANRRKTRSLA